jgi:single-strand DNA-binding protein
MSNVFQGAGNLGDAPTLKRATVNGEQQPVLELSIYFDRPVPNDKDEFEDKGGFWLVAELWGKRAERAAALLAKGARVRIEGTLVQDSWVDKESQEERIKFKLKLDWIALDPIRIESVKFKESSRARREAANEADAAP